MIVADLKQPANVSLVMPGVVFSSWVVAFYLEYPLLQVTACGREKHAGRHAYCLMVFPGGQLKAAGFFTSRIMGMETAKSIRKTVKAG